MACRNAYPTNTVEADMYHPSTQMPEVTPTVNRLLFGVDSMCRANDLLQNNLNEFEWIVRNKIYPNFFGRYISGENCLTKEEIKFLHSKGCKIATIYTDNETKQTEEQGKILAKKIDICALELGISEGTAIFLEISETESISRDFMRGFAKSLLVEGFTPGFKVNTDAKYAFDREFSSGMQTDRDVFSKCLIWATAPTVTEYNGITTSHLIHPDNWIPFAPSGISRKEIAIWQYGMNCHPIEDNMGNKTVFNVNLVCNEQFIIEKMF